MYEELRGTAKEADRRLAELRIKYEGATDHMTLDQFWTSYYAPEMDERLAASTTPGYRRVYNVDIKPRFGDTPMDDIKPRDIQEWISVMTNGKAKAAKRILSAILGRAFALGYVDDNVAQRRFVYPKAKAKGQRSKEVFGLAELDGVFREAKGEVWEGAYILAAFGGASREEACGVKLDEISFAQGYAIVPIVRGVQRLDSEVKVLDWTKNEHRQRDLVIPPPYSMRLRELVAERKRDGDVWIADDGMGGPMNPNTMAKRYRDWFAIHPYKYVPFGNLRNSYGTMMESLGVDGMMVSKLLGHSQPSTFYKHYFRPSTEDKLDAINRALS